MDRRKTGIGSAVARNRLGRVITQMHATGHLRLLMWVPVLLLMVAAVKADLHGESGIFCLLAGLAACLGISAGLLDSKR